MIDDQGKTYARIVTEAAIDELTRQSEEGRYDSPVFFESGKGRFNIDGSIDIHRFAMAIQGATISWRIANRDKPIPS